MMTRDKFLGMRDDLMKEIETIIDTNYGELPADEIVGQLCDAVCQTMDPAGLATL